MIPIFKVFMSEDVEDFLSPVLHSGYIGEGEKVKLFEDKIGEFIQNENVVAVNSGTAAITMALRLVGVGRGDFVVTTPMTCLATNEPILSLGAIPVWVDIHSDGTMQPMDLERKIGSLWKKPKAILCMDWGGLPCDLLELNYVSELFNIPIIEDACQALGSVYNDKPIGNHADFVAFSFQAIKHLTTADGGALVVNDPYLLKEARLMRWFGLDRTQGTDMRCYQDPVTWGYKSQMNDITASIGLANIRHLPWILSETRRHADVYNDELKDLNTVRIIKPESFKKSNYWLYTLLVNDAEDFMNYMKTNYVDCSKVHDRNDTKRMFYESREENLPGVDYFEDHHICIPVGWWVKDSEIDKIVSLIKKYDKEKA